ncbi:hypothetical protein BGX21_007642, partial [Mortierella sp. AD011]
ESLLPSRDDTGEHALIADIENEASLQSGSNKTMHLPAMTRSSKSINSRQWLL